MRTSRFVIIISLFTALQAYAQPGSQKIVFQQQWQQQITIPATVIPEGITGDYSSGYGQALKAEGKIYLLLTGITKYGSEPYTNQIFGLDSLGKIIVSNKTLLPAEQQLQSFSLGADGRLYCKTNSKLIIANSQLQAEYAGDVSYYTALLGGLGEQYFLAMAPDSIPTILDKKLSHRYPYSEFFCTTKTFKDINSYVELPLGSSMATEGKIVKGKNTYSLFQNNTVLAGPDHEDIWLYSLNKQLALQWYRQLSGRSQLGHLEAQDMGLLSNGNTYVIGYADDAVNFRDSIAFDNYGLSTDSAKIFFTPLSHDSIDLEGNEYLGVQPTDKYYFLAVYSPQGKLLDIKTWEPDEGYARYKLLSMQGDKLLFYNTFSPKLYTYDYGRRTLTRANVSLGPASQSNGGYYYFASPGELYVVSVQDAEDNRPPVFDIRKYTAKY